MLRFHMVVITTDNALRQALRRLAASVGATAAMIEDAGALRPDLAFDLVVCDTRTGTSSLLQVAPPAAPILYLVPGGVVPGLGLLGDERAAALLSLEGGLDEDEFIVTATKLLRGELFGSQKYLPWGVTTFAIDVGSYADKERALQVLLDYAVTAGCRTPLRERIGRAADELMMNGLYHAPVDENGVPRSENRSPKELMQLVPAQPIRALYASSGSTFLIAVQDAYGSLGRGRLLSYLSRAASDVAIEDKPQGAGLGLISLLRDASRLVFNLEPGGGTEVIALFDRGGAAIAGFHARSLAIFIGHGEASSTTVPPLPAVRAPGPERRVPLLRQTPVIIGLWVLLLAMLVAGAVWLGQRSGARRGQSSSDGSGSSSAAAAPRSSPRA